MRFKNPPVWHRKCAGEELRIHRCGTESALARNLESTGVALRVRWRGI